MSVSFWWIGYLINDEDHARIRSRFETARRAAEPYLATHAPAIEAWRANPGSLLDSPTGDHWALDAFQEAFTIPSYSELFGGDLSYLNAEEIVCRFSILHRSPLVSVLWYSLGYERARALPGDMGNLLVAPADVANVLATVSPVFRDLDQINHVPFASDADISEIISFLPDGLRRARELGKGFFSLALRAP